MTETGHVREATVVAVTKAERILWWTGFPLLGAGVGWLLVPVVHWLAGLPPPVFRGPVKLLAAIPDPAATIGGLALGLIAGLLLAGEAEKDTVSVAVGDEHVTITRGRGTARDLPRESVGAVFLDRRQLVVLGHDTKELARQRGDLPDAKKLATVFRDRGYPWRDVAETPAGAGRPRGYESGSA